MIECAMLPLGGHEKQEGFCVAFGGECDLRTRFFVFFWLCSVQIANFFRHKKGQIPMNLSKAQRLILSSSLSVFLVGCGSPNYSQSEMHITVEEAKSAKRPAAEKIPALVKASPTAPVLSDYDDGNTFDVVVTSVPVRDLLFALARDAGVNMDIDDQVGGVVSISALDQTLEAILERISQQVAIRVERVGDAMVIKPDLPYHKYYQVEYLNIARAFSSSASTAGVGDTGAATVGNTAGNNFWESLENSIANILEIDYIGGDATGALAVAGEEGGANLVQSTQSEIKQSVTGNSYNLNPDTGVLVVYAPDALHSEIQNLLDRNMAVAKRQVLLEATVVEVVLNNQYSQGIDWSLFNSLASEGLALYQGSTAGGAAAAVEYLTSLVEVDTGTREFNAAAFGNRSAQQLRDLVESFGFSSSILSQYGLTDSEIGDIGGLADGDDDFQDNRSDANLFASRLSAAYLADLESSSTSLNNDFNRVTELERILESEFDDGSGLFTYSAGLTYTVEEVNDTATAASSGGLRPNNPQNGFFTAAYRQGDISAAVQLLDTFGDAKILSSPRISALNHQPALLRVVDQEVYFTFEASETINEDTGQVTEREFTVEENTVDVGFSMNVFPLVSENNEIILNLKPAVTRVIDYRQAPILSSYGSAAQGVQNFVPITRVRELESVISLRDGEIAVLGGLLEDRTGDNSSSVPGLSRLPGVGKLFEQTDQSTYKTEFVVFIRARIINNPSVNGDYSDYRHLLPNSDFILRNTESTLLPPDQLKAR